MTPIKYFNALIEKNNMVPYNTVNAYYWTHFNDVSHPPVYLSMAEIWSAWANRQSQFLVVSLRPHWAQWNSGYNGRSHRALPSVPSTAMKNTHGDGRPGKIQRMLNIKTNTLVTSHCVVKSHVIPAPVHVLFRLPFELLRTKRISFTLSLFASSVAIKSYVSVEEAIVFTHLSHFWTQPNKKKTCTCAHLLRGMFCSRKWDTAGGQDMEWWTRRQTLWRGKGIWRGRKQQFASGSVWKIPRFHWSSSSSALLMKASHPHPLLSLEGQPLQQWLYSPFLN